MLDWIKKKKIIIDFGYSFIAYALPVAMIQVAVQPIIAKITEVSVNALFIVMYGVVKLCMCVIIEPLASLRLLEKKKGKADIQYDGNFNFIFLLFCALAGIVTVVMNYFYNPEATVLDYVLILIFVELLCAHDYYHIEFRIDINFKRLLTDNILLTVGYGIGCVLFLFSGSLPFGLKNIFGHWEMIFIIGYTFGLTYVLSVCQNWRRGIRAKDLSFLSRYGMLCCSAALSNTTIYCDKLIIYPVLGEWSVSVYSSATVVSKILAIITNPLRHVLLSYIVDKDEIVLSKKKIKKYGWLIPVAFAAVYIACCCVSVVLCYFLYRKFFSDAMKLIPLIVAARLFGLMGGMLNIALLRFGKSYLQTVLSGMKAGVYLLLSVLLVMVFDLGLWSFCIALCIANVSYFTAIVLLLRKHIKIE